MNVEEGGNDEDFNTQIAQPSSLNMFKIESDEGSSFQLSDSFTTKNYQRRSLSPEGATLAWRDVSVYIHSKNEGTNNYKRIVNDVTGAVKTGSLVALIGSSGAGKTTLMSALAYRSSRGTVVEGDILINGRPIGNYMRYLSGFMHQEDLFVGALTVLEHMNIMGRLKLDRRTSENELKFKINDLLRCLGLTKCSNTRIGVSDGKVLSGGERKRLAFATELLTDPPLLFCDEPTTGLDSYSAQKIIGMMNMMASNGKTIVCTIHQPSSEIFAMFSQIVLLADGKIAYMGPTARALTFFSRLGYNCPNNYNPADFFIKTVSIAPGAEETSQQIVKKICSNFVISDEIKEVSVVVQYEFHKGRVLDGTGFTVRIDFKKQFWFTKMKWLIYRMFLQILRDPAIQILRLLQKIAIAVMVGLCYLGTISTTQNGIQSVQGALFVIVSENTFIPMYAVLAEFPQNTPLFIREYKSGLYPSPLYYFSKIIAMLPGLIIEPVIFVLIIYWFAGLRLSLYAFFMTVLIAVLTLNVSAACGIFFSNAFESVPIAMVYLVPFDFILMVTTGIFVKLSSLTDVIELFKYLSWMMYSLESMSIVQWDGIHNITCEITNPDLPCLTEGSQVLDKYSFSREHLNRDLWNMLVLWAIFHLLGFLCLWRRTKIK